MRLVLTSLSRSRFALVSMILSRRTETRLCMRRRVEPLLSHSTHAQQRSSTFQVRLRASQRVLATRTLRRSTFLSSHSKCKHMPPFRFITGARWDFIRDLKETLSIPVIGNGDVYTGADAVRMLEETGCDGIMIGRASLGRPFVFTELRAAMEGGPIPEPPQLAEVLRVMTRHYEDLVTYYEDDRTAAFVFRKFAPLYLLGFDSASELKRRLCSASSREEFHRALETVDWDPAQPFPRAFERFPRLKGERMKRQAVSLPPGWLDESKRLSEDVPAALETAEACEG